MTTTTYRIRYNRTRQQWNGYVNGRTVCDFGKFGDLAMNWINQQFVFNAANGQGTVLYPATREGEHAFTLVRQW